MAFWLKIFPTIKVCLFKLVKTSEIVTCWWVLWFSVNKILQYCPTPLS